ncbi:MAG: ABC transporter substrate-binding protein [Xanthobacteraceae bacterium]
MRRRELIKVLSGAAAAWPLVARAQHMPSVGFLTTLARNDRPNLMDAFRSGLGQAGYVDGRNVTIEYRFGENDYAGLPVLASELVARNMTVIIAAGGGAAILAAKAATTTTPIVFLTGGDPVQEGFVLSLNRPGGNLTGVSWFGSLVSAKAIGLLHEVVPKTTVIGLMVNPNLPEASRTESDAHDAARTLGLELLVLNVRTAGEIHSAFATLRQRGAGGLVVGSDPFFTARRQQIVTLATRDAIPTIYSNREFAAEGGLMSYGNDVADAYRRAGLHVARILKGDKPSELPIDQAVRFEFVINLSAAKGLGLSVPPTMLAQADEVIE